MPRGGSAPTSDASERVGRMIGRAEVVTDVVTMSSDVVAVRGGDSVLDAARAMRRSRVGCLVVNDDQDRIVGIVTERDLVHRILADSADPDHRRVSEIMTANVASCEPGVSITRAREIMIAHRVRHLPVVADGVAVGIVSVRDVIRGQLARDRAMKGAAEQIAMLSTCLKSLDFGEVVDMVAREVPKIFQADRCVLCLPKGGAPGGGGPLIRRHNCSCPERELRIRECPCPPGQAVALCDGGPEGGAELGCAPPSVVVPLEISGFAEPGIGAERAARGYLCMCGLARSTSFSEALIDYKGGLLREILNANLTNARIHQEIRRRSVTDPLTGTATRRLFEDKLESECVRANRYERPFCIAIVDVDNFKVINDRLGHAVGDRVLRELGESMMSQRRASDLLARYGGDEFVLLMPETALDQGLKLVERIRHHVRQLQTADGLSMTVSAGLVERSSTAKQSANELIRQADLALYEAKRGGRDRTETWERIAGKLGHDSRAERQRVGQLREKITEISLRSKDMLVQSISGLIRALEARDRYTRNHSENVMRYAVGVAETLGLTAEELGVIRRAAIVHDIGKIGLPDTILRKPGKLTRAEHRIMERHPVIGVEILGQMSSL